MYILTAVNDKGRLHVGYGEKDSPFSYPLGESINRYRDPISKFFTGFFGFSMDIDVAGKRCCVNKKSLQKHLASIPGSDIDIANVKKSGYACSIDNYYKNLKLPAGSATLGDNLSHKKRILLFKKMVGGLKADNTASVKKLIRKGAYVQRSFTLSFNDGFYYDSYSLIRTLIDYNVTNVNYYELTPMALACKKGNQALAKFIYEAQNKDFSSDQIQTVCFLLKKVNNANGLQSYETKNRELKSVFMDDHDRFALKNPDETLCTPIPVSEQEKQEKLLASLKEILMN